MNEPRDLSAAGFSVNWCVRQFRTLGKSSASRTRTNLKTALAGPKTAFVGEIPSHVVEVCREVRHLARLLVWTHEAGASADDGYVSTLRNVRDELALLLKRAGRD